MQSYIRLSILFIPGKIFIPKQKPVQSFTEEKFSLDPELEEALTSATDTELGDLAGEAFLKDEWAGTYLDKKDL